MLRITALALVLAALAVVPAATDLRAHSPGSASLTALSVSAGVTPQTISPAFSSTVYYYTARVHNSVAQVTIAGTPDGDGAVSYQYTDADSEIDGHQVNLPEAGAARVDVVVRHTDGGTTTTQTYTVLVIREGTVETDRAALIALYNSTNGPLWTNNTNWGSTEALNTWHGVVTGTTGRVTSLWLPGAYCAGNNMVGNLPDALGNLDYLFFLNMCGSGLNGMIPDLSRLTYLQQLYLNNNDLSGTIPATLGDLTNLQKLGLWGIS